MMEYFASASSGTEIAVRDELRQLGMGRIRVRHGGVAFLGSRRDGWLACLHSRLSQRIMRVVGEFDAPDQDALYEQTRTLPWAEVLTPAQTLAVSAHVNASHMIHSGYAALKVKDAIVDSIRDAAGARPDVSRDDPDVRVFLHLHEDHATLYLDLSGIPLFMRGYRTEAGGAPLKETLAAALLYFAGWDRKTPLIDPMCGSGTVAIEAALWAGNVAPGIRRPAFGFERWADFTEDDAQEMREIRGEARHQAHGRHPRIVAADIDPEMIDLTSRNARRAGVRITARNLPLKELTPDGQPRLLVTNPPYDVRLGADNAFYQEMTSTLKRLSGWRVCILSGTPLIEANMGQEPVSRARVRNGKIPCEALVYDIG